MAQYGAAAGAALGNAAMPGVGGAVGGLLGSFLDGGGVAGGGGAASPLNSQTAVYGSGLDGSGWAINIGSGKQDAASSPTSSAGISPGIGQPAGAGLFAGLGGLSLDGIPNWFWFVAAGVVLWKRSR